ncbi:Aste57867_20368 [Aphanomyces stellatus]|uniref:subtilisin n=1 Tax=Aphanomyces stellatus TaxID=120398 RepID=A0A485LGB6_9STRA|nr:hypothetical protein As57867_020302 [Aphanomyces stellatus]VFT97055.1 Aste57867_20368 [Aphanomyces stellatus]
MKVALVLSVAAAVAQAKVSVGVLRALETSKTVTALIYYNQPSFDALPEASDRRQAVFDALTKHQEDAKTESASVLSSADCKEYYIASVSVCKGLTADDIKEIAKLPGVQSIGEDFTVQLDTPLKKAADGPLDTTVNQWGIETIGAPAAWKYFTGKGVVVGSIDTGAEYRHPAIKDNWRSNKGWFNPYNGTAVDPPCDTDQHGTHTIGTMVGKYGIGVAPGAQWISCLGLYGESGSSEALMHAVNSCSVPLA